MWESVYCTGWVDGSREGSNCCMDRLLLDIGPPHWQLFSLLEQCKYLLISLPFRIR